MGLGQEQSLKTGQEEVLAAAQRRRGHAGHPNRVIAEEIEILIKTSFRFP